ncbi:MAG: hypothetical protein CMF62_03920 [Magnetococcales bacterium]|nr:hypothetical protein [Magnetococcales bacterium]
MVDIVNHGTYYNPAHLHYKKITQVQCDRCKKVNIDYCLGYGEYDLCFNCVAIINNSLKNKEKKYPEIIKPPTRDSYPDFIYPTNPPQFPKIIKPPNHDMFPTFPPFQKYMDDTRTKDTFEYRTNMMDTKFKTRDTFEFRTNMMDTKFMKPKTRDTFEFRTNMMDTKFR